LAPLSNEGIAPCKRQSSNVWCDFASACSAQGADIGDVATIDAGVQQLDQPLSLESAQIAARSVELAIKLRTKTNSPKLPVLDC
jgi:hypothetical protein